MSLQLQEVGLFQYASHSRSRSKTNGFGIFSVDERLRFRVSRTQARVGEIQEILIALGDFHFRLRFALED